MWCIRYSRDIFVRGRGLWDHPNHHSSDTCLPGNLLQYILNNRDFDIFHRGNPALCNMCSFRINGTHHSRGWGILRRGSPLQDIRCMYTLRGYSRVHHSRHRHRI